MREYRLCEGRDIDRTASEYVIVVCGKSAGGLGTMEVHGQSVRGGRRIGRVCGTWVPRRQCSRPHSGTPVAMVMAHRVERRICLTIPIPT